MNATPRPKLLIEDGTIYEDTPDRTQICTFFAEDGTELCPPESLQAHWPQTILEAVNAYDALRDALEHALHDAESRLYVLPVKAEQIERDIITIQIAMFKAALARAGKEPQP